MLPLAVLLVGGAVPAPVAHAQETGLPVPRFVTITSDEANLRTGPGRRFPVEWVYVRRSLPVEVIAEFDTWRKTRDVDGVVGWVHQSLLSGRRSAIVTGTDQHPLRTAPRAAAPVAAVAEPGVIAHLVECPGPSATGTGSGWCRIEGPGFDGWLPETALWGVYPGERVAR